MNTKKNIEKIRLFNRLYMPFMNLLGNRYLGSEYSITEARIFFEIYENEGCHASHISKNMNIDKSYLSRMIKEHEKNGYITRTPSKTDKRSYSLFLTEKGRKRAQELIEASNLEIGTILQSLSEQDEQDLIHSIDTIIKILSKQQRRDCNESSTL